jgi:hypothetical protein
MIPVKTKQENICPQVIEYGNPTELNLFFQDYLKRKSTNYENDYRSS